MREEDEKNTPHDMPHEGHGGHVRRARRARGGSTPVHVFPKDSPEADEASEEKDEFRRGGHARKKHAVGGVAQGAAVAARPDRAPRSRGGTAPPPVRRADGGATPSRDGLARGGHAEHHSHMAAHHGDGDIHMHRKGGKAADGGKLARGGRAMEHNPFSSGHTGSPRDDAASPAARGYEGVKATDPED